MPIEGLREECSEITLEDLAAIINVSMSNNFDFYNQFSLDTLHYFDGNKNIFIVHKIPNINSNVNNSSYYYQGSLKTLRDENVINFTVESESLEVVYASLVETALLN